MSRIDSLLKPYFVVMSCVGIALVMFRHVSPLHYWYLTLWGTLFSISEATGNYFGPYVWSVLWFLPHLFVTYLFSWLIAHHTKSSALLLKVTIIVSIGILGLVCIGSIDNSLIRSFTPIPQLPFSSDLVFISSSFLLSGYYLSSAIREFKVSGSMFAIAAFGFFCLHYFFDSTIELGKHIYDNPVVSTLEAIFGIYLVLCLASYIEKFSRISSWFSMIGAGSLFILLFHWLFQALAFRALTKVNQDFYYLNGLLAFVFGAFMPLVILNRVERSRTISAFLLPCKSNKLLQRNATNDAH